MKKLLSVFLSVLLVIQLVVPVWAAEVVASGECGENVTWVLDADGVLTISGTGAMDDYANAAAAPWYAYRNEILGVAVEESVTRVGNYAFYYYPQLQVVACAARTIGERAFAGCETLLAVDLLEGVEEVSNRAFYECESLLAVSVPASMKHFGERAFEYCDALQAVLITDLAAWCGIKFDSYSNFGYSHYTSNPLHGNADLYLNEELVTELAIPDEVTSISAGAFCRSNLTSVIMHDNVTEVASYAFFQTHLTELKLSAGLETIQPHTFSDYEMDTLVIPEGVKRIENMAFAGASNSIMNITAVHFPSTLEYLGSNNLEAAQIHLTDLAAWCGVEIPNEWTAARLGADFYLNGQLITDLVIPGGVTEIKPYTFMGASIQSLTLPDSVVSIGAHAFRWSQGEDSQLSRVTWSKNLQSIGEAAFRYCALQQLVLPDSVQTLGTQAFFGNRSLTSIHIGKGLTKLGDSSFAQIGITELVLPSHVKELGSRTFSGCDQLTRLDLGSTLTAIPGGAFAGCSALTKLVIPDQITSIGEGAFSGCTALTDIDMGAGLTVIPKTAFKNCSALTAVTVGENVEVIEDLAFEGCRELESIVMPTTLKELGSQLFKGGYYLKQITFTGDAPVFAADMLDGLDMFKLLITINYPCDNPTWKEDLFQNYSHANVQWLPGHSCKNGVCTRCGAKEIVDNGMCSTEGGVYWILEADGTLTVYGKGVITYSPLETPFSEQVKKVIIKDGIDHLSGYTFTRFYTNLKSVIFTGDAPTFDDNAFGNLTTTAYYPADNPTWTKSVRQNYGGKITWKPLCPNGHTYANGVCTFCGAEEPVSVGPVTGVVRIFGADRYETAFKTAEVLKQQLGVEKFDNIVVACGDNFADALGGSYLAAKKNAPILLVKSSKIDAVKSYIKANLNPGGTVYLLGGTAAIPAAMDTGLDGFTVRRLAGATRYDTNLLILEEAGITNEDILICTGKNFADSLSAAAAGRPILLVKDSLNDSQKAFLQSHAANKKYILGGTAAVSTSVENQAKAYGTVERIGGNTRYETSVLIAQEFFPDATQAALAYAQNFPDGLSGGALAYAMKAPLVLTASGKEAAAAAYAEEQGITSGVIFGGSGLISDKAVRTIFQMQSGDIIKLG